MIAIISTTMTPPTARASGRFAQKPSRMRSRLTSSIITTKRNRTMTAPTYTSTSAMARNSARSSIHSAAAVKKASTRNKAECTGLRAMITHTAAPTRMDAKNQKTAASNMGDLAVGRVGGAILRDLLLIAVAHGEEHFLGVVEVSALLAVVLEDVRLDDRVHRAGFLAQPAEDALGEVDVVARGAPRAVGTLLGLDGDRQRRAHRFAQLAGDAALLAVGIAAQGVQPAKARAHRGLLLGKLDGDLAAKDVAPRQQHALHQLDEQKGPEEFRDALDHDFTARCSTAS